MNYKEIITLAVQLAFAVISALITAYVVPYLKKKNIYDTVKKLVQAAEKLAENANIDKKAWVKAELSHLGVKMTAVTDTLIDAFIESAVKELDIAVGKSNNKAK